MSIATDDARSLNAAPTGVLTISPIKTGTVIVLAALADWLFYGHDIGISAAIFLTAVAVAAVAVNPRQASGGELLAACTILVVASIPIVLQSSPLATMFGILGVANLAITMTETGADWKRRLSEAARLIFDTTWRAPADVVTAFRSRTQGRRPRLTALVGWVVPLGLGTIFLMLFSSANPLIDNFMSAIDLRQLFAQIDMARIVLWLLVAVLVWPFVFPRRTASIEIIKRALIAPSPGEPFIVWPAGLLNDDAILRSLALFNALFAVQSLLDLTYLWGGAAMPAGMSYASYAHRGAYPLIVTALLAAAFVIVALKPGSNAERSRILRLLVFVWIGQNVLLVSSSILRLDLYVQVYSLSYWRFAAGIWMGLVAIGLVLIVARIALGRSNRWLVGMNVAALMVTLYGVSLIDIPAVIAKYNVEHSREVSGKGQPLDTEYLKSLGPHAIPAIDRDQFRRIAWLRDGLRQRHLAHMTDWRAWSYFDAALARYLQKHPTTAE